MPRKTNKKQNVKKRDCNCNMKGGSNGQEQLLPGLSIRNYYPLNQYNDDPSRNISSDRLTPIKGGNNKKSKSKKLSSKKNKTLKKKYIKGGKYLSIVNPNLTSELVKNVGNTVIPAMV